MLTILRAVRRAVVAVVMALWRTFDFSLRTLLIGVSLVISYWHMLGTPGFFAKAAFMLACVGAAWTLGGRGVVALSPQLRARRRSLLSSKARWGLTFATFLPGFLVGFTPVGVPPGRMLIAEPALAPDKISIGAPFDGDLTSDERYLFFTTVRTKNPGIGRVDFERGTVEARLFPPIAHEAAFILLDEAHNQGFVSNYASRRPPGPESRSTALFWFRMNPFETLPTQTIPMAFVSRGVMGAAGSAILLTGDGRLLFSPLRNEPRLEVSDNDAMILDGRWSNLENASRERNPDGSPSKFLWIEAEFGPLIDRLDIVRRKVDKSFDIGLMTWSMAVDQTRQLLFVSRYFMHRVDVFDSGTGKLVKSFHLPGITRPLLLDPDGRHLYVGLYSTGLMATIDIETGRVLGYTKVGYRVRRLLWRSAGGGEVIAVTNEGIFRIPATMTRDPERFAGETVRPSPIVEEVAGAASTASASAH